MNSLAFVATDAEDDVVVGNERVGVVAGDDEAGAGVVDPVLPIPNTLQLLGDLDGDVIADGEARAHRRAGEIEAKIAV